MKHIRIDEAYLKETLVSLLNIHSPTGFTDQAVHFVGDALQQMGVEFNVTRRGAIRATLPGLQNTLDRAIAAHIDTLGAMVRDLKTTGKLALAPVGTWAARFAEGGRATVFTEKRAWRGTVLPMKSSGHVYGDSVDTQPASWDNLEMRVDCKAESKKDLEAEGFEIGDFVAFDSTPEITPNGFINARHLDDKAGVAVLLAMVRELTKSDITLPVDCHLFFTISEEVGSGASAVLYGDVAEMVAIDHAPADRNQNAREYGVTVGMMDQTGPFDYHLTRKLIRLCKDYEIPYGRDIFRYYRTDSASAIEAGNDTRTALLGFALDASHGYERTHIESLTALGDLIGLYIQSPPTFARDKDDLASIDEFPHQPARDVIQIET